MGASWIVLLVLLWFWQFHKDNSFLLGSRVEDLVDKRGNPKSLFWKLDYALKHQPNFLVPPKNRTSLNLENLSENSVINGESTTGEFARGDRRTAVMLDEFGMVKEGHHILRSTRDVTACRIFNSTTKGANNAFAEQYRKMKPQGKVLEFHWSKHPAKTDGYWYDEKGKIHSPWYEEECARSANKQEIAQELDMDFLGSNYQFFEAHTLTKYVEQHCKAPFVVGNIDYDLESYEAGKFIRDELGGQLRLWFLPSSDGTPPLGDYVIGADISMGTGASDSVLSVYERSRRVKMAELINNTTPPDRFGLYAVCLANWFKGENGPAHLIWESNGPGAAFGDAVVESGFRNMFMDRSEDLLKRQSLNPGWHSGPQKKITLLSRYRTALAYSEIINYSAVAVRQCYEYIYDVANQRVVHARSVDNVDPSASKDNHGDCVIADALGWHAIRLVKRPYQKQEHRKVVPWGSMAYRQMLREDLERRERRDTLNWRT